ncbi:snf2 family helicase atpase [Vairimorpha apis BRL 01]|uniref:Snf2 family helicase atpase n=1 Tax=Vairimorpha apis BRL 01 TaxID=1037528 RepID=T0MC15_9MICR|nr:snf2 family helicase atpase [Vairimorpha apis BRL 01]
MYCDLSIRQKIYYESIIDACRSYELENIMMQLRKVCNHPDLFEKLETTTKLSMYRFEECGRTLELGRSKIQLKIPLLVADLCKERRELFDRNFCIENGLIYKNELQILFNKKRDFLYENLCFLLSESGCNKNISRIKFDVLGKLFKDRKCNFIGSSDGIKNDIDFNKDDDFNLINNNNKLEDSIKLKNEFKDKIKLNDLISNDNKIKDSIKLEDKNFNSNKNDNKVKDNKLNQIK